MKTISSFYGPIITYELLSDFFLFQIDVIGSIINQKSQNLKTARKIIQAFESEQQRPDVWK